MSPLRLAFMIRSVYDVLPSRTYLQKWGIVQDASCSLCGCSQSLRHVLSSCSYAFAHERYMAAQSSLADRARGRETAPARRIYFLREGSSQHRKEKNDKQRRDLLSKAKDWEDRMDLSNALNRDRYLDLTMDLEARGYGAHLFAIDVGARGLVGRSMYAFLRAIGLSNRQTKHFVKELSEAAESASHWIWTTKDRK